MTHPLWHIDAVSGGGVHPIGSGLSMPSGDFQVGNLLCWPEWSKSAENDCSTKVKKRAF
jgi:hypothetical protein